MQALSNRVSMRDKLLGKDAVHNYYRWSTFLVVTIRERPATEEPRAHCAQVVRADPIECPNIPVLTNGQSVGVELGAFTENKRDVRHNARKRRMRCEFRAVTAWQT